MQNDGGFSSGDSYSNHKAVGGYGDNRPSESFDGNWSGTENIAYSIDAPKDGQYQVVVTYNGDDYKEVYYGIDNSTPMVLELPSQSDDKAWDKVHTAVFTVTLTEGTHTLYMSSPIWTGDMSGAWLNYDCIDISKYPITEQDNGALRYEGEYAFSTGYETSGGTHYSGSLARGGFNQDIELTQFTDDWSNVRYTEYNVYAQEAGTYTITFGYDGNNASDMQAVYKVNDGSNKEFTINGAGWSSIQTTKFDVELNKGFNTIKISGTIGDTNNWANDDYIDVIKKGAEKEKAISGFTRYEGENAIIVAADGFGGGHESQDFFSGKASLSGLSNSDVSISDVNSDWSNVAYGRFKIKASYDGDYRIVIAYNGNDDKKALIRVNNDEVSEINLPSIAGGSWNTINTVVLTVSLKEGSNTIDLTGALGGGWWNIDYVDASNYPITINADGSERYEAECFDTKSANKPVAEHQDMYSGLADANGVGGMGATYTSYEVGDEILGTALNYVDYSIFVDEAGFYDITVMGNGAGNDMECVYSVNKDASKTFTLYNKGKAWNNMISQVIHVKLKAGLNDLLLAGTYNGSWLNYDYIDVIYSSTQEEIEEVAKEETPSNFTRYEAENGAITGGSKETQGMYSGKGENGVGAMAGTDTSFQIGDDIQSSSLKYIKYTVEAPKAGKYIMVVAANGADKDMPVAVQTNGGESKKLVIKNSADGYSWDRMLLSTIIIDLNKGTNEIVVSGTYEYIQDAWLNYDYIDLAPVNRTIDENGNDRYEAEDFVLIGCSSEHQNMYSGENVNNGVGGLANSDENFEIGDDIEESELHYIEFAIIACKAGRADVEIVANGADKLMPVAYQLNDGSSQSFTIDNTTDGYSWDRLVKTTVSMDLKEGYNKLVLAGTYDYIDGAWLNYDYIEVKDAHISVDNNEVEATCTEEGLTGGTHCQVCGETIIPSEVVPAKGHKIVVDEAVSATKTSTGLTAGSHCSVCGETIVPQTVISKLSDRDSQTAEEKTSYEGKLSAADKQSKVGKVLQTVQKLVADNSLENLTSGTIDEMVDKLLKDLGVNDLALAMQDNTEVRQRIKDIDARFTALKNIKESIIVTDAASKEIDKNSVSVVGLGLNALEGEEINLVVDKPEKIYSINTSMYKNADWFDISSFAGTRNVRELKVPMTITMPLPKGLSKDNVVILHFDQDGKYETITPVVNDDGTVTFTVTHLSTFAFANAAVSPKTNDYVEYAFIFMAAIMLIMAATIYVRRRKNDKVKAI